jgi:trimeric autotransporter adhesin
MIKGLRRNLCERDILNLAFRKPCARLIGGLLAISTIASAQQPPPATTTASGVVRTAEGEPVPGATVRLTNTDMSKVWVSWTDESGKFEVPGLPPGHYRAEASQLGFTSTSAEVQLAAGMRNPLDLVLRVAALAELEPTPGPPPTSGPASNANQPPATASTKTAPNPSTGAAADSSARGPGRNRQLPPGVLNAMRQGMARGGFQQTDLANESGGQADENLSSAQTGPLGNASSSDSFLLRGTVGQGLSANGPAGMAFGGGPEGFGPGGMGGPGGGPGGPGGGPGGPGQSAPAAPGFGPSQRGGGQQGQFPGGGFGGGGPFGGRGRLFRQAVNRVRFGFYDRYENSVGDARPFSLTGVPSSKISHYDERVGGSMGGPLKIPHVYNGSDRTFFFVNFNHDSQKSPVDTFATVPTLAERQGDFSALGVQLFDPRSNIAGPRTPLGDKIPQNMIDDAAKGVLAFIPLPNLPGNVQNFHLQSTVPLTSDSVNLHVLHTINSKFNVQGGYNFNSVRQNTLVNFPLFGSHQSTRNQNVDLGLTQNWSPQVVNDTHLNWSRSRIQVLSDNSFGADIAANLGITGISSDPINFGVPLINYTNFSSLSDPVPSLTRNQTLRFIDSVTYTHAKHTWRWGGELRRIEYNTRTDPIPRGSFTFTGLMTSQLDSQGKPVSGTGFDFADFLLGLPQATNTRFGSSSAYFRGWGFVGYAQDDWRIHPRFTFDYGVRYEAVTPPVELFNKIANLDLNFQTNTAAVVTPGVSSFPRALIHGDYGNWAPRIGFAWNLNIKPKTVVRAGYSIFYNEAVYSTLAYYLAYQPPFATAQTRLTTATQLLTLENGFPAVGQTSKQIRNTAAVDPFYRNGYAQIWMLGTETDLSPNWILNLTYTGTKGTDLDLLRAPNRAPPGSQLNTDNTRRIPNAGGFTFDQSGANSIYNAIQARLVHRFSQGFTVQGIYTFAKSLDNASTIGGSSGVVVQNDDNFAAERGLSSFDIRHQVRLFSMYELPFGERKRWAQHGWSEHVFGNWRIMNVLTWQTGTPYTALVGGNASDRTGTGANFSERPDQVGDPNLGICGGSPLAFFNTAAFALPPSSRFGDAARTTIEGPCTFNWNVSLAKSFLFGPSDRQHRFEARWEVQNLTNTPNFNGLSTLLGSSTFGRVTGAASMRTMDIMLRVNF